MVLNNAQKVKSIRVTTAAQGRQHVDLQDDRIKFSSLLGKAGTGWTWWTLCVNAKKKIATQKQRVYEYIYSYVYIQFSFLLCSKKTITCPLLLGGPGPTCRFIAMFWGIDPPSGLCFEKVDPPVDYVLKKCPPKKYRKP